MEEDKSAQFTMKRNEAREFRSMKSCAQQIFGVDIILFVKLFIFFELPRLFLTNNLST